VERLSIVDPRYENAMALESQGRFREAFALFKILLDSNDIPDRGDLFFHCGWCLEHEKNLDDQPAYDYYRQAAHETAIPVCRMNSFFRAGWLRMGEKNYKEAIELYRKAIELHESRTVHDGIYREAAYWLAVCLEGTGRYLEALEWYRTVQRIAPLLAPESRFREIQCLNRIGAYPEALEVCRWFEREPPQGFDKNRYKELRSMTEHERKMLEDCLCDEY
jgi:tetratricopeptide (TPR) repeat protein